MGGVGVLTVIFDLFFYIYASYIFKKYSDFLKMKIFSDFGGIMENMYCHHVYKEIGLDICPDCGGYTHETNREYQSKLFKEYYSSDAPKAYKCPIEGGTIRGWWSI